MMCCSENSWSGFGDGFQNYDRHKTQHGDNSVVKKQPQILVALWSGDYHLMFPSAKYVLVE